jgi:hypothetical protein
MSTKNLQGFFIIDQDMADNWTNNKYIVPEGNIIYLKHKHTFILGNGRSSFEQLHQLELGDDSQFDIRITETDGQPLWKGKTWPTTTSNAFYVYSTNNQKLSKWVIDHNSQLKPKIITVFDDERNQVFGDEQWDTATNTQFIINFPIPVSGSAILLF